jgi:tRNA-dihydrouridine synthase C
MRIFLAPMEGVADHRIREILTAIGGIDVCVTEFVRIIHNEISPKVFKRYCPEIDNDCKTSSGTPVRIQLLGGDPEWVAVNAANAAKSGANAIDLNFGCPAKQVNNSDGGASLLRDPQRVYDVVSAVRKAVPDHVPVSAKIRLGFEDRSRYLDNAMAVFEAGASELAVHARSKVDGYKPPAYWEYIAKIKDAIDIPVIANGEVWSVADYHRCREVSGCEDVMIGRGLMCQPDLARQIKADLAGEDYIPMTWAEIGPLLHKFHNDTAPLYPSKFLGNRLKQWLAYLRLHYPEANDFFDTVKRLRQAEDFEKVFRDL